MTKKGQLPIREEEQYVKGSLYVGKEVLFISLHSRCKTAHYVEY